MSVRGVYSLDSKVSCRHHYWAGNFDPQSSSIIQNFVRVYVAGQEKGCRGGPFSRKFSVEILKDHPKQQVGVFRHLFQEDNSPEVAGLGGPANVESQEDGDPAPRRYSTSRCSTANSPKLDGMLSAQRRLRRRNCWRFERMHDRRWTS
jgi:hypothetical protein